MKRKIGVLTPVWNQELFIKPHFDMVMKADLDRYVVLMQSGPLPQYHKEHRYSKKADLSRQIIEDYFPTVEIYDGHYPTTLDFGAELYNEGLLMMEECDIVLRLDPDMFWTESDFNAFIEYIRNSNYDAYKMDFRSDSINYYMTGDFTHGLKDAQEDDTLAINPHYLFRNVLDCTASNQKVIDIPNWMCHHFRGWNKPKSTPSDWATRIVSKEYIKQFGNKGGWFECPDEIRIPIEKLMMELKEIKETI